MIPVYITYVLSISSLISYKQKVYLAYYGIIFLMQYKKKKTVIYWVPTIYLNGTKHLKNINLHHNPEKQILLFQFT